MLHKQTILMMCVAQKPFPYANKCLAPWRETSLFANVSGGQKNIIHCFLYCLAEDITCHSRPKKKTKSGASYETKIFHFLFVLNMEINWYLYIPNYYWIYEVIEMEHRKIDKQASSHFLVG